MAIKPLPNEQELLWKVAGGDHRAFSELFYAYHEPLAKYVYTLLESVELCEEIVQDVFVKIWENRMSLPQFNKFTDYLFILTRNYTVNCIRKMIHDKKHTQLYFDDVINDKKSVNVFSIDQEYQDIVQRAVAQLPPSQQKVLQFRQQGLKTREIAQQMGISTDSVKKYQQWASQSVSKFLKSHAALSIIFMWIKH